MTNNKIFSLLALSLVACVDTGEIDDADLSTDESALTNRQEYTAANSTYSPIAPSKACFLTAVRGNISHHGGLGAAIAGYRTQTGRVTIQSFNALPESGGSMATGGDCFDPANLSQEYAFTPNPNGSTTVLDLFSEGVTNRNCFIERVETSANGIFRSQNDGVMVTHDATHWRVQGSAVGAGTVFVRCTNTTQDLGTTFIWSSGSLTQLSLNHDPDVSCLLTQISGKLDVNDTSLGLWVYTQTDLDGNVIGRTFNAKGSALGGRVTCVR
jgi:hypothetical protein